MTNEYTNMKTTTVIFLLILFTGITFAQPDNIDFSFRDTGLPIEDRIEILVSQMTLEEKTGQMLYNAPAIPRLGVPEYNWWNEALHGVARAGYATVFPQSITIAASWDKNLVLDVATAISDEARAKHHEFVRNGQRGIYQGLTMWSPNINIFRDPRWGRGHETYGEDPHLTGQLGMQFVKGLQGEDDKYLKLVATAKHYAVHSGPERLRHEFNADVSDVDLYETYLPAFKTLIKDAYVYSVMGAYNLFRGEPCCANPFLYNILRKDWGFEGYIVSDCWAISDFFRFQETAKDAAEASALAVKAGTDLNCGYSYDHLNEAVEDGLLTEEDIDKSVKRLFTARFKLGMFDSAEENPYAQIPYSTNCSDEHNYLARQAAQKSIVLLKNGNNILPLSKKMQSIAVIGPNADNWESLVGNYNGIAKNPVTVLQGIRNKVEPEVEVVYSEGSHLASGISNLQIIPSIYFETEDGQQGIKGEYYNNNNWEGEPLYTQVDDQINFYWEQNTPSLNMSDDNYSVRWSGYLIPPVSGKYQIGTWAMPVISVEFEGEEIAKANNPHHAMHQEREIELEAGVKYKIVYKYANNTGDGDAKLLWAMPNPNMLQNAVKAAEKSDVVILVLGLSQRLEGEEGGNMPVGLDGFDMGDRTHLKLPEEQIQLMKAVKATNKPVILVLMNGSAMAVNWADANLDGIMQAGYAGQQGGNAVADVIFGDYNPAGRLPVTYYKSVDQLPDFENYNMEGRTYRYFRDEPLYDFGYGLSYTSFTYSNLQLPKSVKNGEAVEVSVDVSNSGEVDGDEVVQLYITDEKASTPRPIRQLEGFKRINIKAGDTQTISFWLNPYQFSIINSNGDRVIEPGNFTIAVGGKQPGSKADTSGVLSGKVKMVGKAQKIN
jgi:beta-glucosidase